MATERSVKVRLNADPKGFVAGMRVASAALHDLRRDIDKTNDRTAWLAQSFLALGPTLSPLAAVGAGALAGLATQLTFTAVAAGTATLAFNGIGDALKALNDYQIDPTAAHLKAMHRTMAFIGPTGRDLVRVLDDMRNGFIGLSNLTRDNMFPGVIDGLHELKDLFPQVQQIVAKTAAELGDLASRAGEGLSGPRFQEFFDFLEADAVPTLDQMARTVGNVADGLGAMLVAFAPLSRDFSGGMLEMSRAFADWAHGLRDNTTFQEFIDYIRENTPRVLDLIGQMVDTLLAIGEAAGPVGEIMIPVLTEILKIVEALVDSPLGPIFIAAAAAMSLYGRAAALASITTGKLGGKVGELAFGFQKLEGPVAKGTLGLSRYRASMAKTAGTVGIFALAMSPLPEKLGLSNTALGAMTGSLAGPWGAAVGAGVGLMFDLAKSSENFQASAAEIGATLDQQTGDITKNTRAWVINELQQQGVLQAARESGVNLEDLTDATLGNKLALEQVNRQLATTSASFKDADGHMIAGVETTEKYRSNLDLITSAIGGTNDALNEGRDNLLLTGDAMGTTARKFKKAAVEVDYFGNAVEKLNEQLEKRATLRGYQQSIDDLAESVKKNGQTLDITTQKGRDNQAALDDIANTAIGVAETLSGTRRTRFLEQAQKDFDAAAAKLGLTREQSKNLRRDLGLLDALHAKPAIAPKGIQKTHDDIDKIQNHMRDLDNMRARPQVILEAVISGRAKHMLDRLDRGYAEGGYTGNAPASQAVGVVHGQEFVHDAQTTAKYRGLFEALHRGANLPGYQQGGYVAATAQPSMAMAPGIDYERLGAAIAANSRQLFGDMHISGDPTVWRRETEALKRAANVGGLPE